MAERDLQREILELLIEVDEHGRRLSRDEIDFVADLIDRDVQKFSIGQISRIKALHRRCVEPYEGSDDDDEL